MSTIAPEASNITISAGKTIALFVIAVFSLIGNAATIVSILKRGYNATQQTYSHIYQLILHLSIADLLVTVFCLFGECWWNYMVVWPAGNVCCKIFKYGQEFSLYLSTYVLVLIGLDRFMAVRYPMRNIASPGRFNRLIAVAWLLSSLLSIPQLFVFQSVTVPEKEKIRLLPDFRKNEEVYQCTIIEESLKEWVMNVILSLNIITMFAIPLIILITSYRATVIAITQSEQHFRCEGSGVPSNLNRRRLLTRAKQKSLRLSIVIVVTFLVCWIPYYLVMICFMLPIPNKNMLMDYLEDYLFWFGMVNSLINPLIYGAFHLWRPRRARQQSSLTSVTIVRYSSN